jgi:hypothetical protein
MARLCGGEPAGRGLESGLYNPSLQFEDCRKRADSLMSVEGAEDDNHGSDHD